MRIDFLLFSIRHRAESRKIWTEIRVELLFVYSSNCNFLHIFLHLGFELIFGL